MKRTNYIGYRPTWAEINLDNLAHNFSQVKRILKAGIKAMVCVKADAYGHGLIPVSRRLISCGADYLSVASIDEAITLRDVGIKAPILILGMILKEDIAPLFNYNLAQTVCSQDLAFALNNLGRRKNKPINIHIKIDTGMGRLGVLYQEALALIEKIQPLKFIKIEGLFTHFPCADVNRDFTLRQIEMLDTLLNKLKSRNINIPLVHSANSLGVVNYPDSHFNLVRPGLVIYGLYPQENLPIDLKPVLSLKTKVTYFKKLPKGHGVSYGHTYFTKKQTTVVTLPIGYGDGYPRNLSNKAAVLIRGERFKVSGRVCMDQTMVDVGELPVRIGDEAVLIGAQGKNKVTAEELAELSGTIPYEIVCGLGSRIPRVYI